MGFVSNIHSVPRQDLIHRISTFMLSDYITTCFTGSENERVMLPTY